MGVLDEISSTINKGTSAASRSAQTMKLRARVSELNKQRQQLAAQLGASLYDATRESAEMRVGRESLYDGIAALDDERSACMTEIAALESESNANRTFSCPVCNAAVSGNDLFCSGCGTPTEQFRSESTNAASVAFCMECGNPIQDGEAFCMNCGWKVA